MLQDEHALHPRCREMDSVKSGMAFAAGEVAMMVNWFGFAAMSETIAESKVKGRIDIAPIPHGEGGATASLNVYWVLAVPAGSQRADLAYSFLRHCASGSMDKRLTLEGGIGCRRSTWADAEVREIVPFYSRLEQLHQNAREMPQLPRWPEVVHVIDAVMLRAMNTDDSIPSILKDGTDAVRRLLA
jgi:multiple sugar transport system substrate-binding protein